MEVSPTATEEGPINLMAWREFRSFGVDFITDFSCCSATFVEATKRAKAPASNAIWWEGQSKYFLINGECEGVIILSCSLMVLEVTFMA